MGTFDRSQFKASNLVEMKQEEEKVNSLVGNKKGENEFVELVPGNNTIRWYPAHPDSKSSAFLVAKAVSWINQEVWVKADNEKFEVKNPTQEQFTKGEVKKITKRKPVFNSKVHGGTKKDLIEEYISFTSKRLKEEITDQEVLKKKLEPMINWKTGLSPKTSYIGYCHSIKADGSKIFGRLEITYSVKEQHNTISNTGDANAPIVLDPFTDPDKGKAVLLKYDKGNTDAKKVYSTTLLWQNDYSLTDDELSTFMECDSLEKLYVGSFKRSDFEKQLAGIQLFDKEQKYNTLSHDSFLDIVEEISNYYPEDDSNEDNSTTTTETESTNKVKEEKVTSVLDNMSREALLNFITTSNLDLVPRATHGEERIKSDICELVAELNPDKDVETVLMDLFIASSSKKEVTQSSTTVNSTESRIERMKREAAENAQ